MRQLTFELLFELGEWWKVSLIDSDRELATDSEVEMWCAMIEMANAPRDPVIIEQPTASVNGPTLTKNEASRIMNGTAFVYDQLDIMGQIVNIRAFPGIAKAMEQAALIYELLGKRFGIQPKQRHKVKPGEPTFADVINAEMRKQSVAPGVEPATEEEIAELEQAVKEQVEEQVKEQVEKGGTYATW